MDEEGSGIPIFNERGHTRNSTTGYYNTSTHEYWQSRPPPPPPATSSIGTATGGQPSQPAAKLPLYHSSTVSKDYYNRHGPDASSAASGAQHVVRNPTSTSLPPYNYDRDQDTSLDPLSPTPVRKAAGFRTIRDAQELTPSLHSPHSAALKALTINISATFYRCNPQFSYETSANPRRVLTSPSKPIHNDGYDNEDYDYILYVNDLLGGESGPKYLILDILGSQVVKCQNVQTNEIVAVKVIKNKPAYFNNAMMEVTIVEMLNKEYDPQDEHRIVRLLDSFVHRSHICMVFELLSSNLNELLKQNSFSGLSTQLVKVFTAQLLDSLTVLKEARLIHCDLKPENILLKSLKTPEIKLIDFGSACHEKQTVYTYIQSRFYRSPEVLLGVPYTSAIDMWSLGCIAVELFLGLPLFPGTSEYNQITRIVELLGLPPKHILDSGKQTSQFCDPYVDMYGQKRYQLKSLEKYTREHNTNEQPGKNYFTHSTLPEIIKATPIPVQRAKPQEAKMEQSLRLAFIDFVQGLLNLDPLMRWTPQQARSHPFITGKEFTGPFMPLHQMVVPPSVDTLLLEASNPSTVPQDRILPPVTNMKPPIQSLHVGQIPSSAQNQDEFDDYMMSLMSALDNQSEARSGYPAGTSSSYSEGQQNTTKNAPYNNNSLPQATLAKVQPGVGMNHPGFPNPFADPPPPPPKVLPRRRAPPPPPASKVATIGASEMARIDSKKGKEFSIEETRSHPYLPKETSDKIPHKDITQFWYNSSKDQQLVASKTLGTAPLEFSSPGTSEASYQPNQYDLTGQVNVQDMNPKFKGNYSSVFQGTVNDKLVAIKVIQSKSKPPTIRRRMLRERTVWTLMKHPNILPFYGYTEGPTIGSLHTPFGTLISPWYENGDASKFLEEHGERLSKDDRTALWKSVIDGVAYLHQHQPAIIHGDLKPGNVIIDDSGCPRICDFGLAQIFYEESDSGMTTTTEHTGTDRYLAPELLTEEAITRPSAASDIYAVGCLGLEFIYLKKPYSHRKNNLRGIIYTDIKRGVPPAVDCDTQSSLVWSMIKSCWDRQLEARPSALMMIGRLSAIAP